MIPDPKNNRDFLLEAVSIVEKKSAMKPDVRHLKALYDAWLLQIQMQHKVKNAISNLAKMHRDGQKMPTKEELPFLIKTLTEEKK